MDFLDFARNCVLLVIFWVAAFRILKAAAKKKTGKVRSWAQFVLRFNHYLVLPLQFLGGIIAWCIGAIDKRSQQKAAEKQRAEERRARQEEGQIAREWLNTQTNTHVRHDDEMLLLTLIHLFLGNEKREKQVQHRLSKMRSGGIIPQHLNDLQEISDEIARVKRYIQVLAWDNGFNDFAIRVKTYREGKKTNRSSGGKVRQLIVSN